MLTVAEAAGRLARDPETIRRWIRSGRLQATKVGGRYVIDEADLATLAEDGVSLDVPVRWKTFASRSPQPDWVAVLHRSRGGR